ncbi:MAG: hypothetical protein FWD01_03125 [Defluviitaleaceae bacterium]|nr:hypothetical protein [Defluviitaleaceae bacterium]
MAYADQVFSQILNEHLMNLHTAMPCRVTKYYPDEHKADIKPLFSRIKGGETQGYPEIKKAPCLKHIEPLEVGDEVFVVFAERALDYTGNRRHDLTDAVIVGQFL